MFTVPKNTGVASKMAMNAFPGAPGTATPQEKILSVSKGLGIEGMDVLQATTRSIYDTLPVDGRLQFDFFKGCNNRAFPDTNLSQNKLEVGEAFIVETMHVSGIVKAAGVVTDVINLGAIINNGSYTADFTLNIANSTVVKPISLVSLFSPFNPASNWNTVDGLTHEPYQFRTMLTIPSLQEFIASLQFQALAVTADNFIRLTLEGIGVIYRPSRSL